MIEGARRGIDGLRTSVRSPDPRRASCQTAVDVGTQGIEAVTDTRRLESSFASIDFFEDRRIPFVVGVNCFNGEQDRISEEIRAALDLSPQVPLLMADIRHTQHARDLLVALVEHLIARHVAHATAGTG